MADEQNLYRIAADIDALWRAWRSDGLHSSFNMFSSTVDELLCDPCKIKEVDAFLRRLDKPDSEIARHLIESILSSSEVTSSDISGRPSTYEMHAFWLPMVGLFEDVRNVLGRPSFPSSIAKIFRDTGLLHPDANLKLFPVLSYSLVGSPDLHHRDLSALYESYETSLFASSEDASAVKDLHAVARGMGCGQGIDASPNTLVALAVPGFRYIEKDASRCAEDYFGRGMSLSADNVAVISHFREFASCIYPGAVMCEPETLCVGRERGISEFRLFAHRIGALLG